MGRGGLETATEMGLFRAALLASIAASPVACLIALFPPPAPAVTVHRTIW